MNTLILIAGVILIMVLVKVMNNRGIAQVDAAAAQEMIKDSGTTILDVRTPPEFQGGHIKGAKLVPVAEIGSRIGELEHCKDLPVLVYCHAGSRSASAAHVLKTNGFTKISNLSGGITAWNSAGFKTVRGN